MPKLPVLTIICALHSAGRSFSCLTALRAALDELGNAYALEHGAPHNIGAPHSRAAAGDGAELATVHCIAPEALAETLAPLLPKFAPLGGARHWVPRDSETWYAVANRILGEMPDEARTATAENASPLLLLLHEDVELAPDSLVALRGRLAQNDVCGVTPLLLTPPFASGNQRVLHLGTVADARQQVHHLYEGVNAGHPLTSPHPCANRIFQTAPEVALLVRVQDFVAVGGFSKGLDELTGLDLGLRLARHTGQGFACAPQATATWHDLDASWRICGLWNSLAQRGRFAPGTLRDDYASILANDGVSAGVNEWLGLCPQVPQGTPPADAFEAAWLASRRHDPVAMLQYLQATPQEELPQRLALCRSLPELHPHAFAWYTAQAASLLDWARETGQTELAAQVAQWQKRARRFHHGLLKPIMQALQRSGFYNVALDSQPAQYDAWLELEEPRQRADMGKLDVGRTWPEIAVIVPVYNPEPRFLREALDSVLAQRYDRWQLCVADDASTNPDIASILREYAAREPRLRLTFREQNGHISRASNSALELADAPFAAFFDHDDLLHPDALARVAEHLADNPAVRFVYTDEDKVDTENVRRNAVLKPEFDMDLHYTGHLSTFDMQVLRQVGGLRLGVEGSQDMDLSLRVAELLPREAIAHIPHVLYHWRVHTGSTSFQMQTKPYVLEATQKAWADSCARRGFDAEMRPTGKTNFYRPFLHLQSRPTVTLVLLEADGSPSETPVQPLLQAQIDDLATYSQLHIVRQAPNSPSSLAQDNADVTIFLDASMLPGKHCALTQLLAHALRPEIAVVSGELWQGGSLYFAGWYPNADGCPTPLGRGLADTMLPFVLSGQMLFNRRILAPAWQCVAVKTADFMALGGLDMAFGQWAWVDYALRAEAAGKGHCLLTPWAQWQITRPEAPEMFLGHGVPAELATQRLRERWGDVIARHGTRNPLLQASPDNGWRLRFTMD